MEDGSTIGTALTYIVLAIVLLAIAFGVARAGWFFSMLVAMNVASRREEPTGESRAPEREPTTPA
jgi:hypothetical protein